MAELYLRQLLVGRDVGRGDPAGTQMQNFVYLLGDREAGKCLVVDPAWDVAGITERAREDGMRITGALVTHYHPDHCGGSIFGLSIEGVAKLQDLSPCKVHVHRLEGDGVKKVTGLSDSDLAVHQPGDVVTVGDIPIQLVHTPGHTPGSQCFLIGNALVSGDTLFLDGCGRTDLPGSNPEDMYDSLQRLAKLPEDVIVFPGHQYHPAPCATLGEVCASNYVFRPKSREQWLTMFGRN